MVHNIAAGNVYSKCQSYCSWAPAGERGKSRCSPPPPPIGKSIFFTIVFTCSVFVGTACFLLILGLFSPCGGFWLLFSPCEGHFLHVRGLFVFMWGLSWACPPPSTKISGGAYVTDIHLLVSTS